MGESAFLILPQLLGEVATLDMGKAESFRAVQRLARNSLFVRLIVRAMITLTLIFACLLNAYALPVFAEPKDLEPLTAEQLSLFDGHGSVMMLIHPEDGAILYVNQAAVNFYGYSKDTLIGMNISEINTLSKDQIQREMAQAVQENRNYFRFMHRLASGDVRYVEVYAYPVEMVNGEQLLFSIVHDVTDKRIALEQLSRSVLLVLGALVALTALGTFFAIVFYAQKRAITRKNQHMRALIDNMQEGFALFEVIHQHGRNREYILREVNPAFCAMLGQEREALVGKRAAALLDSYDADWHLLFDSVAGSGKARVATTLRLSQGTHQHITLYRPEINTIALMATDMTTLVTMHQSMDGERHYYHHLLNALGQGVVALNSSDEIVMINNHAAELLRVERQGAIGRRYREIFSFERKLVQVFLDPLEQQPQQVHYDLELRCQDGRLMPMELNISPLVDAEGHWTGTVFTFSDYSEMRSKEEEILYLSRHDQLTGLYNRHYFEEAMERLDHPKSLPLSLVMIDVNGLKMTNDAFGHEIGDILLKMVASHLKAVCRADDIVARIGGDEFVLLLPRTDVQQLQRITNALQLGETGVEPLYVTTDEGTRMILLSYAVGTVIKHHPEENTLQLIRLAENKMYQNKLEANLSIRRQMIETILQQLFELQPNEREHASRVSALLKQWAEKMALEPQFIEELELLGLVHDIGKIVLTKHLLQAEGPLSTQEWPFVKRHSESGFHILRSVEGYGAIAEAVLDHHERWQGKGYPRGLEGNSIHWMGRMLAIADAFEAITADRPYRPRRSAAAALEELQRCSGTQFDPELIQRLLDCFTLAELEAI